ncbi:MAG TPA: peptide ABC transporter permease, partial [bacterium]|nr:peptide ABC transporter permease [bacterium]
MALGSYILRRLLLAVPTLLGVTAIVFLLMRLIPGDPARIIAGLTASDEEVQRIRVELGLTRPLHVQYLIFLDQLRRGDLGTSAVTR